MWVHCPRASNGLLPRRSNLVGYVRRDARSDRFPPCQTIIPTAFRSLSGLPTTRPEPHLYASQNSVCAGIVDRVALLSKGGWDAFSKTPTASNAVICFRVELHLESEPTRHRCADSHTV